ncbi:MAG: radical SAM protein [Proteobacteria bacterium]|jgi:hypothetical protein|nr:radical SAM protein [Pseudomonadota bacterium]
MRDLLLPGRGDSVVFITPPTLVVESRIFLYGHDLYTVNLHTQRLIRWLEGRGVTVAHINCHTDAGAGARRIGQRPAGPRTAQPKDVECYAFGLDEENLRERLVAAGRPSQVWITSLFAYDRDLLKETIRVVRSALPGVPVSVGGTYASLCAEECARMGADYVHHGILTESEETLGAQAGHCGFVVAGRGCPNRCAYCAFHRIETGKPTTYPEHEVLAEVDRMMASGVSLLALYAPSVFRGAAAESTDRLFAGLAKRDTTTIVWAGFEPLGITPKRAELIRAAGTIDVGIPLQTHDRGIARKWGRRETLQDYLDTLQMMRDAGYGDLEMSSDIIVGHPDTSLEESIRTACFVWSQGLPSVQFPYTCVPGSADAASLGVDFSAVQAESLQPYLWPFAREDSTANDCIQFSILSRVLPQCIESALSCLDPDSVVPSLVRRYLDEFGFSVPQWNFETKLPPLHIGYQEHLSHPWELVLTLQKQGGLAEAAKYVDVCEHARVCEPGYLDIPLAFFGAGMHDAAIRTLRGAARCLPNTYRAALDDALRGDTDSHHALMRGVVAAGLRRIGRENDAERWQPRIPSA